MKYFSFQSQWICGEEFAETEPRNVFHREGLAVSADASKDVPCNCHMAVRSNFFIPYGFKKVILRLTSDDYYKLWINGSFVGQGPAQGYYFSYYYNEYDITSFVNKGENQIFLDVYYQGLCNRVWNSGDNRQGLVADILVDGRIIGGTDGTWEYTYDPRYISNRATGYDTQFLEDYDSRKCLANWRPVCVRKTDYRFYPKPQPTLEWYDIEPQTYNILPDGTLQLDFGHEITGTLCIEVNGHSGERLIIRYGEELLENGRVRFNMRCNCLYEETWILADGESSFEGYDYKAFRYAEIIPTDGKENCVKKVAARVRHYPFDDNACTLYCSDEVLKSVFEICKSGVKFGSQEVFVDCPSREKGQYAGDLTVTGASHIYLTGDIRLFKKAIENLAQSQTICDGMLAVAPGSLMQEIADYSLQFPILLLRYYHHTGDRSFLREMLPVCEHMLAHFEQFSRSDGLLENVDSWNLVDWPENMRDDYDFPLTNPIGPGCHAVINAFYIGALKQTEEIKRLLKIDFVPKAESLRNTFNSIFLLKDTGCYADRENGHHSSLHANVIPVYYGLEPEENRRVIANFLKEKGMCCGVYMSYFYLKALAKCGEYQKVYDLLTSTGHCSWYNMVREGGTTCFEAWGKDQKINTSLCHPWASAPISIIIEDILGISYSDGNKETLKVSPHIPQTLKSLEMQIPLLNGCLQVCLSNSFYRWKWL